MKYKHSINLAGDNKKVYKFCELPKFLSMCNIITAQAHYAL